MKKDYNLDMDKETLEKLPADIFMVYLAGLSPNSPLGRVVSIRAEDDKEILETFTKEQLRIRNDYRRKIAKRNKDNINKEAYENEINAIVEMFKQMGEVKVVKKGEDK